MCNLKPVTTSFIFVFGETIVCHALWSTSNLKKQLERNRQDTHTHTHRCQFTYLHSYPHEGTWRHRRAHIPLAPSSSYCIVMNGVSPVHGATGPCSGPLGAWGCSVAFLPCFLSPDSAPAVHTSRRKNMQRVKNYSPEIHDIVWP